MSRPINAQSDILLQH